MKLTMIATCALAVLGSSLVGHTKPQSARATMFIRPYVPPANSEVLMARVKHIEEQLGQDIFTYEYSIPRHTKIVLTIVARHNGVIDREKSGVFHVMRYVEGDRTTGTLEFSRGYAQPLHDPERDSAWGISLSSYFYGIPERTPRDWNYSWTQETNTIIGSAARKDAVLFAFRPTDRKFTLVIQARFAPATRYQNINKTKRYPLPLGMK